MSQAPICEHCLPEACREPRIAGESSQRTRNVRKLRIYVDTSVFGGVLDRAFERPSRRFFDRVGEDRFIVLVSEITYLELQHAPGPIRELVECIVAENIEEIPVEAEAQDLAEAYIAAGALGGASRSDALHVAAATVAGADLILSWNFKHIVNYERIRVFNSVNILQGYRMIDIRSPLELDNGQEEE